MDNDRSRALREVVRLFLRLGFTAFGGPAAHIAMMNDEVVVRRGWMSQGHFLDLVGATNLIPGPNSTEMAIHIGYERAGWRGLAAAGICFILPAAILAGALAWLYVHFGATPQGEALMLGIKPVILAIVLQALTRLLPTAAKNRTLLLLSAAVAGGYLLGIHELILLFGGMGAYAGQRWLQRNVLLLAPLFLSADWSTPAGEPVTLVRLFGVFLKVGALLYGSGYVLLAFLHNDLVERLGWLSDQQLLDAVAVGQFTPGPVFTTATFVGYLVAGWSGAAAATIAIFLPSFVFVALLNPLVPRLRAQSWTAPLLDGINAASIGLMAGVLVTLARSAIVDLPTLLLALAAGIVLWRYRLNSAWLVLAGGAAGLLLWAIGG